MVFVEAEDVICLNSQLAGRLPPLLRFQLQDVGISFAMFRIRCLRDASCCSVRVNGFPYTGKRLLIFHACAYSCRCKGSEGRSACPDGCGSYFSDLREPRSVRTVRLLAHCRMTSEAHLRICIAILYSLHFFFCTSFRSSHSSISSNKDSLGKNPGLSSGY